VDLNDLSWKVILDQVIRAWYTPTGHIVYVRADGALFAAPFDLGALEITGSAVPLFQGVRIPGNWADMRIADDGTLLYVEGAADIVAGAGLDQLVVVDLEGNEETLPLAPRDIQSVSWSPDGQSVVYSSRAEGEAWQIYTYNMVLRTTPRQLTFEGDNRSPVFSPDGTRVAFSSGARAGTLGVDLFVKNLDDDLPEQSIITLEANQFITQWPSDSLIVFVRMQGGNRDLWMVDLSDPDSARAEAYFESEADLQQIVLSPDGTLAAYRSNEAGDYEIYIRSFPDAGAQTRVSEGGGSGPFWSPDGNTLYFARGGPDGATFFAAHLQRDPVPVVLSTDSLFRAVAGGPLAGSGLHPEGDRFILVRTVGSPEPDDTTAEPARLILVQNFFEELKRLVPN